MPKCSYCGHDYDIPRGLTYVLIVGTVKHLCSSKCRKNMLMKRRKVRWITKKQKDGSESTIKKINVIKKKSKKKITKKKKSGSKKNK